MYRSQFFMVFSIVLALAYALSFPSTIAMPSEQAVSSGNIDWVLLIDESGSLARPASSPKVAEWGIGADSPDNRRAYNGGDVRLSVAKLIIDLADRGDKVAVVPFGTDILVKGRQLRSINNNQDRENLKRLVSTAYSDDYDNTGYRNALSEALRILSQTPQSRQPAVVFLTDGRPTDGPAFTKSLRNPDIHDLGRSLTSEERAAYLAYLIPTLEQYSRLRIPVFPVLLGNYVDEIIAREIAVRTGGFVTQVTDASGLLRAYARIYARLRPDRYIDYLDASQEIMTVSTAPWQLVRQLTLVFEKTKDSEPLIQDLVMRDKFGSEHSLLGQSYGPDGAAIDRRNASHYEVFNIESNQPLVGDWYMNWRRDPTRAGLVIARSELAMRLVFPAGSQLQGFAIRFYSQQHSPLIGVEVLHQGNPIVDPQTMAYLILPGQGSAMVPMAARGLSLNDTLRFIQSGLGPGSHTIIVQYGTTLGPVRLRREFSLESRSLPYMGADTIIERPDGKLEFRFRILSQQGMSTLQFKVIGFLTEVPPGQPERVSALDDLKCEQDGSCRTLIQPQAGAKYIVRLVLEGKQESVVFSDYLEMTHEMSSKVVLDLPKVVDLGNLLYKQNEIERRIAGNEYLSVPSETIAAITQISGPDNKPVPPNMLALTFYRLQATKEYMLRLSGLQNLSMPGEYRVKVAFSAPKGVTVEPSEAVFILRVPEYAIVIRPEILNFGLIEQPLAHYTRPLTVTYPGDQAPHIEYSIERCTGPYPEIAGLIQPMLKEPIPVQPGAIRFTLDVLINDHVKPGGYQCALRLSHPDLPIQPPYLQMAFDVPIPLLELVETKVNFGEWWWPPWQAPPVITRAVAIKTLNINASDVRFRMDLNHKNKAVEAVSFAQLDAEQRLEKIEGNWSLKLTLQLSDELTAGTLRGDLDLIALAPTYARFRNDTINFEITRLRFDEWLWRRYIHPALQVFKEWWRQFFTPPHLGILKLLGISIAMLVATRILQSLWRGATGADDQLVGKIITDYQKSISLSGQYEVYIVYVSDKRTGQEYAAISRGPLGGSEIKVATIRRNYGAGKDNRSPWIFVENWPKLSETPEVVLRLGRKGEKELFSLGKPIEWKHSMSVEVIKVKRGQNGDMVKPIPPAFRYEGEL